MLSRDPSTGELGRRPLTQTFTRVSDHLRVLTIVDDNGERHTLHTTDEHPFFLADGAQVAAGELLPGDELATADGQFTALLDTRYEPHPEGVTVYNFEVADHHTYHVAAHGARGPPVLVHNSSGDCAAGVKPGRLPKKTVSAAESAWRQQHRAERMIRSGRGLPPGGSAPRSGGGLVPTLQGNIPQADKWIRNGGRVIYHTDGSMTYIKNGVSIRYNSVGYPDFSKQLYKGTDGLNQVRITLSTRGSKTTRYLDDFDAANAAAGFKNGTPEGYIWHHHEDSGLMQLVRRDVHESFWHSGGMSLNK